ncbi:MAG: DUF6516 family protein [Chloroflexota bacterium]
MPVTNFPEYAQSIEKVLNATIASGEATLVNIQIDQRSSLRGFISGHLQFTDVSTLHFREFVDTSLPEPRLMYAYHYQDAKEELVFRYDNAAHRPPLPQTEHKHTAIGIEISPAPTLAQVIAEALMSQP